ncbi:MAG: hypothetical protein AAFP86_10500 [Planctomycetota bacterium]
MPTSLSIAAPIVLLAPLAVTGGPMFGPEPDATSSRTFRERTSLDLESIEGSIAGNPLPLDQVEVELEQSRVVTAEDTYQRCEKGMPCELVRSFDDVAATLRFDVTTPEGKVERADLSCDHPLAKEEVAFVWDEDEDAALARFVDGKDDDAGLLDALSIDMDMAACFGADERAEGDRWEVEPGDFLALTNPSGIGWVPLELGDAKPSIGFLVTGLISCRDAFLEPEGTVELWWKSTRDVDGRRCAVFDLDVELSSTADLTRALEEDIRPLVADLGEELRTIETLQASIQLAGEGELVWDLDGRCLHAIELELENTTELAITGDAEGNPLELELVLKGESALWVSPE